MSPLWGKNSKGVLNTILQCTCVRFSPHNGVVILKATFEDSQEIALGFSPRNGEIILKVWLKVQINKLQCFSPRNGDVILKSTL